VRRCPDRGQGDDNLQARLDIEGPKLLRTWKRIPDCCARSYTTLWYVSEALLSIPAGSTRIASGVSGVGANVGEGLTDGTGTVVGSAGLPSEHALRLAARIIKLIGFFRRTASLPF